MTRLAILTPEEQSAFDAPPKFHKVDRPRYFALTPDIRRLGYNPLRTEVNRVGFVLQLGYFRAVGKFFATTDFRKRDIQYVCKMLEISDDIDMSTYSETSRKGHRDTILSLAGWKLPDASCEESLVAQAQCFIEQQHSPRKVFESLIEYCWRQKLVIPAYSTLTTCITDCYNFHETRLLDTLQKILTPAQETALRSLLESTDKETSFTRPSITLLKTIDQSAKPSDIVKNVEAFLLIKRYHTEFGTITQQLQLADQATEYFALWVEKAQTFQLTNFASPYKTYLHVLAFLKHQYYLRQDTLIDLYLKVTLAAKSQLATQLQKIERTEQSNRNTAIKTVSRSNKDLTNFKNEVIRIVMQAPLTEAEKIRQLEQLIEQHLKSYDEKEQEHVQQMETYLDHLTGSDRYFALLESLSLRLQRRASPILKAIDFSPRSANKKLLAAIAHFKLTEGDVGQAPPTDFLPDDEVKALTQNGTFRVSLYKALLFLHVASAIKSCHLIFDATYRFKGIFDYLIPEEIWRRDRESLLKAAGLTEFGDVSHVLSDLRSKLRLKYEEVNARFAAGKNPYLELDKDKKLKVKTPKIDNDEFAFIGDTLMQSGYVPIQKILADINDVCDFRSSFSHFSNKHKKMQPGIEVLLAGIVAKGCNLGLDRLANISVGISEEVLKNTVTWFFELKNIQAASHRIVSYIDRLSLANAYRYDPNRLHTSSDGQKYYVSVDSLNAAYSYKYFGSDQGSTVYTFLDERQALFYSTVFSASEREAAYVLDGVAHNDVVKSNIHSTDTHGYTEIIFGASHFVGTAFAPRIKGLDSQTLYDFDAKKLHTQKGHTITPSRAIKQSLIQDNWEDILRFMATIKLKKASASLLFSRLNSYTKHIPLYSALKEFGRILKSHFILTYYDDVELRQRIEKQLNRVELSNKLAKAIFFANNQEFQEGLKPEQDLVAACKMLIQNAIVLWNYLYLSEHLLNIHDEAARAKTAESMLNGSVLTWKHINLHGEYDFTRDATNDTMFDIERILALSINR